jgi:MFS family permease
MSKDRERLLMCSYTSNVIANLVGGTFWTGFLLLMNADDAFIGTMTMIATAANMLQFFAPLLLERFSRRKGLLIALRGLLYLLNVVFVGLIPLFPAASQMKLTMLAITVLIVNILNAVISPGISIWHVQSVPQGVRPYFYSIITMTVGAVVAVVNLAGSKIVDFMTARGMAYEGFMILRIVAAALCVLELILYFRIKEYPYESSGTKFTLRDLIVEPLRNKLYLRTVMVTFLWNIAANMPGSYYTVYLLRNIGVSYSYITVISMINIPVTFLLTPLWRRVLARHGWFKTLYLSVGVYLSHYIVLALVTRKTLILYPLSQVMAYVFAVGINLSFTGIPYVNMPEKRQTVFIGFYASVAYLAALIGVTIGKYFVIFTEKMHFNILGFEVVNKQALMVLTALALAFAVVGIRAIDKTTPRDGSI